MDLNLNGKKALVLGSSMGIGKSIASALIKEGATVCLNSRSEDNLIKCATELGTDHFVTSDLSIEGEGKRVVEEALKKMGGLDILVTNTGGPQKNSFLDVSLDQWKSDYQNLWLSSVEALHTCLPHMKENKFGRVLMITSVAGKEPMSGLTTSNGLRAGLMGLSKSICHEMAPYGITLNLILPGFTNTDRLKNLNLSDEFVKEIVPAGRLGEPEEIGSLATFLSSDLAGYINGQAIAVDGGYLKGY